LKQSWRRVNIWKSERRGKKIDPNYHKLRAAKEECYLHKDATVISDSVAEVKLQVLLDHTVSRLLKA
jgi:hypothetical protein